MNKKIKLMSFVLAASTVCVLAFAPVIANADCNCNKSTSDQSVTVKDESNVENNNAATTTTDQSTDTAAPKTE